MILLSITSPVCECCVECMGGLNVIYHAWMQVEPEALFQLLLALSQKCSDDLHILDLVEGDKPILPLVCF